ncbi:cytosol aminopeptidase-like [Daktulosphaira vitifoliae]|uniref:cytosol aminopeptidase-like n=1 Tax=Daktulosphaira vitifoliae TaxID=58002 RepID=UPI0021A97C22|nr:cytosol aminopeptidase-like [Daktulosphaira vitifoliae]
MRFLLTKCLLLRNCKVLWKRFMSGSLSCNPTGITPSQKGLVLGCFANKNDKTGESLSFTDAAKTFNNHVNGKLLKQLMSAKPPPARGEVRTFFGLDDTYPYVSVVGLDDGCIGYNDVEGIDEKKECIRDAAAIGVKSLLKFELQKIYLETFSCAESSAEGASIGMDAYNDHKSKNNVKDLPKIDMYESCNWTGWQIGLQKGSAQNLTRRLQLTPANMLTPIMFAQNAVKLLSNLGVDLQVRGKRYIKTRKMNALLAVSKGSCEEPQFLEATYEGCDLNADPIVLVAPGITYNSGGLGSLRSCEEQKMVRGEMSGAASLIAVLRAVSAMKMRLNLKVYIPLAENLIGSGALEPGAVITTEKEKTIVVDSTAKVNQLVVADVLTNIVSNKCYTPKMLLDLGPYCSRSELWSTQAVGVFTRNNSLMQSIKVASMHTGERVWRLPLWRQSTVHTRSCMEADISNYTPVFGGPAMQAAAFLQEFVPDHIPWVHLEIGGQLITNGLDAAYLAPGFSGRPTRTLIELLGQIACEDPSTKSQSCN